MLIGGLQKTTLVDYPGKVAATVFTLGCSFRCHFCHNPELVLPELFNERMDEAEVLAFFAKRAGQLQGVCITGGEPTLQKDLGQFIAKLKKMGYLVKLDSNGTFPGRLEKLLDDGQIDYVAMDIKGPLNRYAEITQTKNLESAIEQSIKLIRESGVDYEFRTTIAKPLHSLADFNGIGQLINGSKRYFIQNFVRTKQINETMPLQPFEDDELAAAKVIMKNYVSEVFVR